MGVAKRKSAGCEYANRTRSVARSVAPDASSGVAKRNVGRWRDPNSHSPHTSHTLAFARGADEASAPTLAQIYLAGPYMRVQPVLPWPVLVE